MFGEPGVESAFSRLTATAGSRSALCEQRGSVADSSTLFGAGVTGAVDASLRLPSTWGWFVRPTFCVCTPWKSTVMISQEVRLVSVNNLVDVPPPVAAFGTAN